MNKRCLILTEAGDEIGLGHLTRCSAILNHLSAVSNHQHQMLVNVRGAWQIDQPHSRRCDWINTLQDVCATHDEFKIAIVDTYLASQEVYSVLNEHFEHVVAIDDYNRIPYDADIVLNPNASYENIKYALPQPPQRLIGGPDYVIIRQPIRQQRREFIVRDSVTKIFITIGGHDIHRLLPTIIEAVSPEYQMTVIAANQPYQAELTDRFGNRQIEFVGRVDATDMARMMMESDLAITACGQTLNELAFLGVPSIGICLAKDQVPNSMFYADRGFIQGMLYWDEPEFGDKISAAIQQYRDVETRRKKNQLGQQIVDGSGVQKICEILAAL